MLYQFVMKTPDVTGRRYESRDELFRDLRRMRADGWNVQHMDVVPASLFAREEVYPEYSFYVSYGRGRAGGAGRVPRDPIVAFYNVAERWGPN